MVRPPGVSSPDRPLRRAAEGRATREALERENFELTALLEIARGLLSAGDPGQAVGQFLLSCVAGVGAASAAGLRWDAERGRLRLWRHYGYQDGIVQDIRPVMDPEDLVFLESAEARSGVSLKPGPDSDRCRDFVRRNGDWLARLDAQAIVPLVGRGGFYGLAVWGPRLLGENYGDDELELLATAAQLCTQALENLMHHQATQHPGAASEGTIEPGEASGALEPDAGASAHLGRLSLAELRRRFPILQEIIGQSPSFERSFREIAMVAPARCPVLVLGETGTGKELVARAIHALSPRAERPVRDDRLRRDPARTDRERAVRPRPRRVHRRDARPPRRLRAGQRRHAVPRRNRRTALGRPDTSCCACCRKVASAASVTNGPCRSTCASWPPRIATCSPR